LVAQPGATWPLSWGCRPVRRACCGMSDPALTPPPQPRASWAWMPGPSTKGTATALCGSIERAVNRLPSYPIAKQRRVRRGSRRIQAARSFPATARPSRPQEPAKARRTRGKGPTAGTCGRPYVRLSSGSSPVGTLVSHRPRRRSPTASDLSRPPRQGRGRGAHRGVPRNASTTAPNALHAPVRCSLCIARVSRRNGARQRGG
jgi:hypothetical protein